MSILRKNTPFRKEIIWYTTRIFIESIGTIVRLPKNYTLMAWLVIMMSNFFLLYQFVIQSSISAMIVDLMKDFDIDLTEIATLSSSYFWSYVVFQIPAGLLIDRLGPRKVMIISVGLSSVAAFIFSNAETAEVATYARFSMGITCAPAMSACIYLAARWLPCALFPLAVGIIEMTGMIGGALGEVVLAYAVNGMGWRYSYFLCAIVCGILCILTWLVINDQPKQNTLFDAPSPQKQKKSFKSFLKLLKNSQIWLIAIYGGLIFSILNGFAALWGIPFMIQQYHHDNPTAVTLASLLFVGAAIGAPVSGYLLNKIRTKILLFSQSILSALFLSLIIYAPNFSIHILPLLLILCGFFGSAYVLPFVLIKELSPIEAQGSAMGFTNMLSILFGSIIFQPLIAFLLEYMQPEKQPIQDLALIQVDHFKIALFPFIIALSIATLISFFIKEHQCPSKK